MGAIRDNRLGVTYELEHEHLVGRAPRAALRLQQKHVSAQHAIVRYHAETWCVRDLGSLNGTFVDCMRLKPGEERTLEVGAKIAFGRLEQDWEFVDDSPPRAMVVPVDGASPIVAEGDFIAVPSSQDPVATIFRNVEGSWILEQSDSVGPITNQQTFEVDHRAFKFTCPEDICKTSLADPLGDLEVRHLHLAFSVSRDEEHVELRVTCGPRSFDLGARNHNYLLLLLARKRIEDARDGTSENSCGWLYQEDLVRYLKVEPTQLNIDVFRIRKQFSMIGVEDAATILERRVRTRQVRLGASRLTIVQL